MIYNHLSSLPEDNGESRGYELISDCIPRIVSQYKIAPFFTHFFQLFGVAQKIGNFLAL